MHGYAAYRLGDPTAKNAGRLTMNPLASIDPFGTILLPLLGLVFGGFIFGYAKPVPYNPRYFRNLRKGELIVGFAGPAANLALAAVGVALAWLAVAVVGFSAGAANAIYLIGLTLAQANLVLMFFNLIPLPPLDGSSIVPVFLPNRALRRWYELQRYSFVIFIALIFLLPTLLGGFNPLGWYFQHTVLPILTAVMP